MMLLMDSLKSAAALHVPGFMLCANRPLHRAANIGIGLVQMLMFGKLAASGMCAALSSCQYLLTVTRPGMLQVA